MAWMFDEQSNHKRQFISFIECSITGKWDTIPVTVRVGAQAYTHYVYRSLGHSCKPKISWYLMCFGSSMRNTPVRVLNKMVYTGGGFAGCDVKPNEQKWVIY